MILDDILARNQAYVRGRRPEPLGDPGRIELAVIACYDPRLDAMLGPALGVELGSAFLLRAAGAHVARSGDPLRSLAIACYLFDVRDVLVVGHTSCRMASFESAAFVDAFRVRGVRRDAFGSDDLRAWVGASPDPRRGVLASVASILSAPFLPRDLSVAGVVLDDTTGALTVVHRPGEALTGFDTIGSIAPPPPEDEVAPPPAHPAHPDRHAKERPARPETPLDAALALAAKIQSKARLRDEAFRLGTELGRARHPVEKLKLLEIFLRRAAGDAREVQEAVADLRRRASDEPPAAIAEEIVRRLGEIAREN